MKQFIRYRRWIVLVVVGCGLYALLGRAGVVPWFDFLPYERHLELGKHAMRTGHFTRAEQHFKAAVGHTRRFPTGDLRRGDSWMALGEAYLWADRLLDSIPNEKELYAQLRRSMRELKMKQTIGYAISLKKRRQLSPASIHLEQTYMAALADYARAYGKKDKRYLEKLSTVIEVIGSRGDERTLPFRMQQYQVQASLLPSGDPAILDTLNAIERATTDPPPLSELAALYQAEIDRYEQEYHAPSVGLIALYDWYAAYAQSNPDEAMKLYAHCATLTAELFEQGMAANDIIYIGEWLNQRGLCPQPNNQAFR